MKQLDVTTVQELDPEKWKVAESTPKKQLPTAAKEGSSGSAVRLGLLIITGERLAHGKTADSTKEYNFSASCLTVNRSCTLEHI
jgi:hypothetical protein